MISIVVCDNEAVTARMISEKVTDIFSSLKTECEVSVYTESEKLFSEFNDGKRWDVYFLDIDMPVVGGFELGGKIRSLDPAAYLIYVSIHREQVYQSFKTKPFRFIPKDEFNIHINNCIEDLLLEMKDDPQNQNIVLEIGTTIYRFQANLVMYIQSFDKYIRLYFEDGTTSELIRYKIGDLETLLADFGYIRTHKRYLVNHAYIQKILSDEILLDNGDTLQISRARTEEIKSTYRRLLL